MFTLLLGKERLCTFAAAQGGRIAINAAPPRYMGKMHCIICFPLRNESFMDAKEMHAGARMLAKRTFRVRSHPQRLSTDVRYPLPNIHADSSTDARPDIRRPCLPDRKEPKQTMFGRAIDYLCINPSHRRSFSSKRKRGVFSRNPICWGSSQIWR